MSLFEAGCREFLGLPMGLPLNPMVLLIIIPFLNGYFIGNIPNIFRQTHISASFKTKQPNQLDFWLDFGVDYEGWEARV